MSRISDLLTGLLGGSQWIENLPPGQQQLVTAVIAGVLVLILGSVATGLCRWIGGLVRNQRRVRNPNGGNRQDAPKRGIAELLEIEHEADAEIARIVPLIMESLKRIAEALEHSTAQLPQVARSTRDTALQRRLNRQVYDDFANRLAAILPELDTRIRSFERAARSLAAADNGYVDWASGRRYGVVTLEAQKQNARDRVGIYAERLTEIEGIIDTAFRSFGGQTGRLDETLEEYADILRRWHRSFKAMRDAAQRVVDFEPTSMK